MVVGNKKGVSKEEARRNFLYGVLNYRMWVFTVTYGFCFGVELVVDNILANYFYAQFSLNLIDAGRIASYSGLMNVCSRASGGLISDLFARRWGMRGRLWWLWFVQTAAGGVCLAFGFQTKNLGSATATMVIFSYLMQAACGATYGVVPFISKRSLGTVSGFVGAGGNTIAAIIQCVRLSVTAASTTAVPHVVLALTCRVQVHLLHQHAVHHSQGPAEPGHYHHGVHHALRHGALPHVGLDVLPAARVHPRRCRRHDARGGVLHSRGACALG